MRSTPYMLLFAGVVALAGCDEEGDVVLAPNVPLAFTRFVHAVPDTSATDWRFIDQLEYSPVSLGLTFRGFSAYQGTGVGTRHLRVFPTSTDINITQNHLVDEMITLEAGRYYTLVHVGYARTGQTPADQLVVIQDDIPTVAATDIAVRAMHLGTGLANTDIYLTPSVSDPIGGNPLFANLAYGDTTSYDSRALGAFALRATPAGQTTPVIASATAPPGAAGNPIQNLTTIGGSTMGGSAILGIFTPGSVVGTSAPQTGAFVVQSSSASLGATATGYTRPSGSFISDGFEVGQTITASGFTNAENNGTSVISAVSATALTVTKTPPTVVEASEAPRSLIGPPRPAWVYLIDKHPR